MQLTDLKQTTVEQILMMFRIPKGLFGMESDQGLGRASVETLEYIFSKWTIDNKLGRLDDFLEGCITDYYPKQTGLIGHVNIIPDDKEYTLSYYNQGVDRWITREEIRERDPELQNNDIKGAEQLFTLTTQVPLVDLATAQQNAKDQAAAAATATAAAQAKNNNTDSTDNKTDDAGKSAKVTLVKAKKKDLKPSIQEKEAYRLSIERNAIAASHKYKQAFDKVLRHQQQTVIGNLSHLASKDIGDDLFDMSDADQEFSDEVTPVLTALALEQGQLAIEFSGDPNATYKITNALKAAIAASLKKMTQNFDAETVSQLSDTLKEGLLAGEDLGSLSDRVAEVYNTASDYRSTRVALTESQSASNASALDAFQQNPEVIAMTWYAEPDCCEFCADLDGTTVGIAEVFVAQGDSVDVSQDDGSTDSYQADYGDVETPPLHPNCVCTIIPETGIDG